MKAKLAAFVVLILAGYLGVDLTSTAGAGEPPWQLPWPTGTLHHMSDGYGYGCGDHTGLNAYALDIQFSYDDQISATAAGTVITMSAGGSGLGVYVEVSHTGGYVSTDGHLRDFAPGLYPGKSVKQGEWIGLADSTGTSTGNHLHFRITQNGTAVKPEPLSWVTRFDQWGECGTVNSPYWLSKSPATQEFNADGCADVVGRLSTNSFVYRYPSNCSPSALASVRASRLTGPTGSLITKYSAQEVSRRTGAWT